MRTRTKRSVHTPRRKASRPHARILRIGRLVLEETPRATIGRAR